MSSYGFLKVSENFDRRNCTNPPLASVRIKQDDSRSRESRERNSTEFVQVIMKSIILPIQIIRQIWMSDPQFTLPQSAYPLPSHKIKFPKERGYIQIKSFTRSNFPTW